MTKRDRIIGEDKLILIPRVFHEVYKHMRSREILRDIYILHTYIYFAFGKNVGTKGPLGRPRDWIDYHGCHLQSILPVILKKKM